MENQDLQKSLESINLERQKNAVLLEKENDRQMDEVFKKKMILVGYIVGGIVLLILLSIWAVKSSVTAQQCLDNCELKSIRNTDNTDCRAVCAKYIQKEKKK